MPSARRRKNVDEVITDSEGRKWGVSTVRSGRGWMAEGYPLSGKRHGKPIVVHAPDESEAYDKLAERIDRRNPKKGVPTKKYEVQWRWPGKSWRTTTRTDDLEIAQKERARLTIGSREARIVERGKNPMAGFRTQDIATTPKGWHVRTVTHPSGHQARIAFPPGSRKKGSGRVVQILHPNREKNPELSCIEIYDLAVGHAGVPEPGSPSAIGIAKGIGEIATAPHDNSLMWPDKAFKVVVRGRGKEHTWTRFAPSLSAATLSAKEAVAKEFGPEGKVLDVKQTLMPNSGKSSNPKAKTREQLEKMQDKAVRFLRDVVGDSDKADEIDSMSPEEYADKKRIHLVNKRSVRKTLSRVKDKVKKALHINKSKKRCNTRPRRNLDEIPEVQRLYETFQGKSSTEITELDEPENRRDDFGHTGWLVFLVIQPYGEALEGIADPNDLSDVEKEIDPDHDLSTLELWEKLADEFGVTFVVVDFSGGQKIPEQPNFKKYGDGVRVAGAASGSQLYFLGGNQDISGLLDRFKVDTTKDFIGLGVLVAYGYLAAKHIPDDPEITDQPIVWQHILGEEGGEPPLIFWNKLQKRLFLAGGTYSIEAPGITN